MAEAVPLPRCEAGRADTSKIQGRDRQRTDVPFAKERSRKKDAVMGPSQVQNLAGADPIRS